MAKALSPAQAREWARNAADQAGEKGATILGKLYTLHGAGCCADGNYCRDLVVINAI